MLHGACSGALVGTAGFNAAARADEPKQPGRVRRGVSAKRLRDTAEEARRQLALEKQVSALAIQLESNEQATFGDIYIERSPDFRVVVNFTRDADQTLAKYAIDPALRAVLRPTVVAVTINELRAIAANVTAALNAARIEFTSSADPKTGLITVVLPDPARIPAPLLSTFGSRVRVEAGPLPEKTQAPTNYIYAGHVLYFENDLADPNCTTGFAVKRGTTYGILTAGHCLPGAVGTGFWHYINSTFVQLQTPSFRRWVLNEKYDYQWHATPGYRVYNLIWIETGTLTVTGTLGYLGQKAGMTVCKYGRVTHYACGTVWSGNYTYNGAPGWIRSEPVSGSFAETGDSGGPVFNAPSSGNVTGWGIIAAKSTRGSIVGMVHMPIDYIDDHQSDLMVITAPSP